MIHIIRQDRFSVKTVDIKETRKEAIKAARLHQLIEPKALFRLKEVKEN